MHGLSQLAAALCALAVTATAGAAPARVVTLAPHATELVYAAGAGDQIVGTVTSSDHPEQARQLPRVGDGILLNQERLLLLAPTHIIAWQRFGAAVPAELLANRMNAQMLYSAPRTLRELPAEVKRIGALLGTQAAADRTAAAMLARIDALEARPAGREPARVVIEVGSRPLYTHGSDRLVDHALGTWGAAPRGGSSGVGAPRAPVARSMCMVPRSLRRPRCPWTACSCTTRSSSSRRPARHATRTSSGNAGRRSAWLPRDAAMFMQPTPTPCFVRARASSTPPKRTARRSSRPAPIQQTRRPTSRVHTRLVTDTTR